MFNNLKSKEFFDPEKVDAPVYVIGCGAIGGPVAEQLVRLGLNKIHIVDDDTVAPHNLGNQIFRCDQVNKPKVHALAEILHDINPECQVVEHNCRLEPGSRMHGYIFMCIDNIDTRRELVKSWLPQATIKAVIDGRMGLTSGAIYTADWSVSSDQQDLFNSMQFTHEEALKDVPVNACKMPLSVIYAPRTVASFMVANFVKLLNDQNKSFSIFIDLDNMSVESYK